MEFCSRLASRHCSLYADDAILLVAPTAGEARAVDQILRIFGDASGLRTNLDKCSITPIFASEEAVEEFKDVLPCETVSFPITFGRACFRGSTARAPSLMVVYKTGGST